MKYLMEKKNHCMHSFERLVRKMSMQIKDPREQDIFCSLLTRKDGMQELAEKYIYLLEDLLRFVKKNGFNALAKLHGIGMKSCEDLYSALKQKGIMESKDNCHLFQYIWV